MSLPSGAWWKQLSSHLHERTHNRLRGLQIRAVGGRVSIQASAPSDRVRSQAEAAAREIVPAGLLAMRIKVDRGGERHGVSAEQPGAVAECRGIAVERPGTNCDDRPEAELPEIDFRGSAASLFAGQVIYRRMQRLIDGN